MKTRYLIVVLAAMAMLVAPVFAGPGNGPKYPKYIASLESDGVRYGQVIYNTNPEDDGLYELEVEIEECMDLVETTVTVKMNDVVIGEIYVDEYGNGKATFYVDDPTDSSVVVEGSITLSSGDWRLWEKKPGPK